MAEKVTTGQSRYLSYDCRFTVSVLAGFNISTTGVSACQKGQFQVKCPFCGHLEDKVIDSRLSKEGNAIRRRRECLGCKRRFTTYEAIEDVMPVVIKKGGGRQPFNRQKILQGLKKACEKRPISTDILEGVVDDIERKIQESSEKEIPSSLIGEEVMRRLQNLDDVAYVRFASVYRQFKDINEFMKELKDILDEKRIKNRKS